MDRVDNPVPAPSSVAMGCAAWIWGGNDPRPMNEFRLFRREFDLRHLSGEARITIFAEFRYRLHVNGVFVQAGPFASRPEKRRFERHAVGGLLVEGTNCIAVEVHCPGIMTGQWTLVNPALILSLDVRGDHGTEPAVVTDSRWKTIRSDAWRLAQMCPYAKGFHENLDLVRLPRGWKECGYDDSDWEPAAERPFYPYDSAEDRVLSDVGRSTLFRQVPSRLVSSGLVDGLVTRDMEERAAGTYRWVRNRWRKQFGEWIIGLDAPLPEGEVPPEPVSELAALEARLDGHPSIRLAPGSRNGLPLGVVVPDAGDPYVVFDFGTVRSGLLAFDIESGSGGTVDLAWDDRIDGKGDVMHARSTPNCDRYRVGPGRQRWDGFFERGLRYAKVIFRGFSGEVLLHDLCLRDTLTVSPSSPMASFSCEDRLLERIWTASVETVRNYVNGSGAGDPIRERCHWFGDGSMALRMAFYIFGEWKTWRRDLELTEQSQNKDGSFPVVSPGHFEDVNMLSGSCYWAVQVHEYVRHTGDVAFARGMFPAIGRHIDYELRFADADGLLYETPGRRFLSWADARPRMPFAKGEMWKKEDLVPWANFFEPPTRGYVAILNAYWIWCLREAAALALLLGEERQARRFRSIHDAALSRFDRMFRVDETGLYRDNVAFDASGRRNPPTYCESTQYSLMRAGLVSPQEGIRLQRALQRPDFACCRTSGGLDLSALPVALLESGHTCEALDLYRDIWGSPILAGATTCGEEFYRSPGNSDCHIHGASPARDFLEYLAGIRIRAPLFREVLLVPPALDGPVPGFQAVVPTAGGTLSVRLETDSDGSRYQYSIPPGCRCFLRRRDGTEIPVPNAGRIDL